MTGTPGRVGQVRGLPGRADRRGGELDEPAADQREPEVQGFLNRQLPFDHLLRGQASRGVGAAGKQREDEGNQAPPDAPEQSGTEPVTDRPSR